MLEEKTRRQISQITVVQGCFRVVEHITGMNYEKVGQE
jgi:hypothetical protein